MPREFHEFGKPFESLPLVWQLFRLCVNGRIQDHIQSAEVPSTERGLGAEQQSWQCADSSFVCSDAGCPDDTPAKTWSSAAALGNPYCEQRMLPSQHSQA